MQVITLSYPIVFEGREIKEINIRRAMVKDLVAVEGLSEGSAIKAIVVLTSKLANLPLEAIEVLDAADFQIIKETLDSFLSVSPKVP